MYGDSIRAGGNVSVSGAAHVGQAAAPAAAPAAGPGSAYCGLTSPVCPQECPQRRLVGGHSAHVVSGGAGSVTVKAQIPFVARCWGMDSASAPFVRLGSIINGVTDLILGGDINGEAGTPGCAQNCGGVIDGYPLLPGQFMTFNFTNFGGGAVDVDIWVSGELLCP